MARSRTQSKSTPAEAKTTTPTRTRATPKAKTSAAPKAKSNGSTTAAAKPRTRKAAPATIGHEQIAAKAYEIWEAKGRPLGMDQQNWQEAEAALTAR